MAENLRIFPSVDRIVRSAVNNGVRRTAVSQSRSAPQGGGGRTQELILIESVQQGNRSAFNELFKNEQTRLFNLMHQLTGDVAAADDLTQEAFLKALDKISGFRHEASFRTWLTRIAINLFRHEYRKRARHVVVCLERITLPANGANPERTIIRGELQWCILHNLRYHLPKKYREVLVLRDLHRLSYREIADILGCSLSLTKTRLHRARNLFRDQFIEGRCKAYTDDYLCVCEGILDLCNTPRRSKRTVEPPRRRPGGETRGA